MTLTGHNSRLGGAYGKYITDFRNAKSHEFKQIIFNIYVDTDGMKMKSIGVANGYLKMAEENIKYLPPIKTIYNKSYSFQWTIS